VLLWCAFFFLTSCSRPNGYLQAEYASGPPSYSFAMSTEVSQSLAAAMARPQIGIDRLPARRVSNEPREAMNCKSCRKRKVGFSRPSVVARGGTLHADKSPTVDQV